ncbi:NAD-dependent epimerase/dehydratase, partial [Methylomonas fluvii]
GRMFTGICIPPVRTAVEKSAVFNVLVTCQRIGRRAVM